MAVLARLPGGAFVPAAVLAEFHGVPREYLSKALQALAQAGLVEGGLGPKGGYRIAVEPSKITLLEIVEAVEGGKSTFHCQGIRFNNPCLKKKHKKDSSVCSIAKAMYQADEAWRRVLREKKLSDIVTEVARTVPTNIIECSDDWILGNK
jgi:Rrf2 family protein